MCLCSNIEFGDYTNMVVIESGNDKIQVDKCLEDEIKFLISKNIKTIASCCGHNITQGFIAVEFADVPKMKRLGYENILNPHDLLANNFFKPKGVVI